MYRRIALAAPFLIAGSGAFAQSSVTMSGYLDAGVYRDSAGTWNVGQIQRSNIAFSGVEDLGNGLAATFMLSHRFETDTGENESSNKPYFHGESTVGLKGGFGRIRLGRALDAMYGQDWQFDPGVTSIGSRRLHGISGTTTIRRIPSPTAADQTMGGSTTACSTIRRPTKGSAFI